MSKNAPAPRPTDAELAILRVLWERGPSTVRQVHEVLVVRVGQTAYTTALKLLQIMTEKGWSGATTPTAPTLHPRLSEEQTQRQLVRDLLDRAFGGSSSKLVMQALNARRATPEELGEIRKLIEARREAT